MDLPPTLRRLWPALARLRWPFARMLPRLDWLQIEISTDCTAACTYCPRTLFRRHWRNRHMEMAVFQRLLPVLRRTRLAYLQGWGDPLTHPYFFALVALAREAGCRVGATTNGVLLDEQGYQRMVREGPDILGFSLAGLGAGNDQVRRGTHVAQVLASIATLVRLREEMGSDRPQIHLAYLLRRSEHEAWDQLVPFLAGRGITQVVISLVQAFDDPVLAGESLVPTTVAERERLRERLQHLSEQGRACGLDIHWRLPALAADGADRSAAENQPVPLPVCTENIQRAAFVGVEGELAPCVFCNLPLEESGFAAAQASGHRLCRLGFGNINDTGFAAIWNSAQYQIFRTAHRRGDFPPMCRGCINLVD